MLLRPSASRPGCRRCAMRGFLESRGHSWLGKSPAARRYAERSERFRVELSTRPRCDGATQVRGSAWGGSAGAWWASWGPLRGRDLYCTQPQLCLQPQFLAWHRLHLDGRLLLGTGPGDGQSLGRCGWSASADGSTRSLSTEAQRDVPGSKERQASRLSAPGGQLSARGSGGSDSGCVVPPVRDKAHVNPREHFGMPHWIKELPRRMVTSTVQEPECRRSNPRPRPARLPRPRHNHH